MSCRRDGEEVGTENGKTIRRWTRIHTDADAGAANCTRPLRGMQGTLPPGGARAGSFGSYRGNEGHSLLPCGERALWLCTGVCLRHCIRWLLGLQAERQQRADWLLDVVGLQYAGQVLDELFFRFALHRSSIPRTRNQ